MKKLKSDHKKGGILVFGIFFPNMLAGSVLIWLANSHLMWLTLETFATPHSIFNLNKVSSAYKIGL